MQVNILLKIKDIIRRLGIEVSFSNLYSFYTKQLIKSLQYNNIDLIVDIGANQGQFALEMFENGYLGKIISIEPSMEAHEVLKLKSKRYKKWVIYPRMAIGNNNISSKLNISANSVSSSVLDILPLHTNSAPDSMYIRTEKVQMNRLDNYYNTLIKHKNILLKIDTQGYEDYVLEGSKKLINSPNVKGILIEVSFDKLYKNQKTFNHIYNKLYKKGYKIWSVEKVFLDHKSGKTLQADMLLYK